MAYGIVNKTGCTVRKGNCQIRLDMFLEPADPRYADRYIEVEPGVWQNTCFHSHFIYLPATFTEQDIKDKIALHLPNFYAAFQDRRDEIPGGMRSGWDTKTRLRPKDYSKTDSPEEYATRVAACQSAIDALGEISSSASVEGGGTFPATPIDMGPGTSAYASYFYAGRTLCDKDNPANDTGTIDTYQINPASTMYTTTVGCLFGSGTTYTSRDSELVGTVNVGAVRTFTGLDIDVATGDFAACYFASGNIYYGLLGTAMYYCSGYQFDGNPHTYTSEGTNHYCLYATGESTPVTSTAQLSQPMGAKLIAGKMI